MSAKFIVGSGTAVAQPASAPPPAAPAPPLEPSPPPAAAPPAPAAASPTPNVDAILALGKKVYETAGGDGCQDCHGANAKGRTTKSGATAPDIRGATEQKLRDALGGGAPLMSFLKLTDEEIEAVLKYLEHLGRQ
jgi:mono/diheme cytochrome c family protein